MRPFFLRKDGYRIHACPRLTQRYLMHRLLVILSMLGAGPAWAQTDLFQKLSGTYGMPFSPTLGCKINPHRVSFFDDNHRARFAWQSEIVGYDLKSALSGEYTVIGTNALGIVLELDSESRLTAAVKPVVWVLRPVVGLDGYCWGRTDWPDARCIATHIRCEDTPPSS